MDDLKRTMEPGVGEGGTPRLQYRSLVVRPAELRDLLAIRGLQRRRNSALSSWTKEQFAAQLRHFPEGQLVAQSNREIVGAASSLVVQWDDYAIDHTWEGVTGNGTFFTHDREGRTLYCADVVLDTRRRGVAVAHALHLALRRVCEQLFLRRIITATRLPGFHKARRTMTAEVYAMRVGWGDIVDPELSLRLSEGFRYCGVIHNYRPEDVESCGNAAIMAWPNPRYRIRMPKRTRTQPVVALAPSKPAMTV